MSGQSSVMSYTLQACDELCVFTVISGAVLSESDDNVHTFFYDHGALLRSKKCLSCSGDMWLDEKQHKFRCKNRVITVDEQKKKIRKQCDTCVSQYNSTWLTRGKLPLPVIFRFSLLWCFVKPPCKDFMCRELNLTPGTVVDWSNYFREVCFEICCENPKPIGRPNKLIEIDEAKIGTRKYNRGRVVNGESVFGGIDCETKDVFLVLLPTRGQATMLPIIKDYVLPGTTIISDCWKSYNYLQCEGFQHLPVNHTYNFIDPDTGALMQNVEWLWQEVQLNVPRYGNKKHHLHGHIAGFLFKRKFSDCDTHVHHLWTQIAELHVKKDQQPPANTADSASDNSNSSSSDDD